MVSNPFRINRLRQLFLFSLLTGLLSFSVAPAVEARVGNPTLTEWVVSDAPDQQTQADQDHFSLAPHESDRPAWQPTSNTSYASAYYSTRVFIRLSILRAHFLLHRSTPSLQTRNNLSADSTEAHLIIA